MTARGAPGLPTGTVTFVLTDIEGSTNLVQEAGAVFREVVEQHGELIRSATERFGGQVVSTEGDSYFLVFHSARQALRAVVDFQQALASHQFPHDLTIKVRVGIHTGEGVLGGQNYLGLDVNRTARITGVGAGGQTLVSEATAALVGRELPAGVSLRPLGSHRLKDLVMPESIFQVVAEGLPDDFPPLRTATSHAHHLPVQLTSFISRPEVEAVVNAISKSRFVTLTGAGGTGKSRTAIEAASRVMNRFADGVWFIALAPISEPALLTSTVAHALGIQPSPEDPDQRLLDHLRPRQLLLLLDNFEQLLEAASQVTPWLQGAPGLSILVTSRGPLRVSGETELPIPPLRVPSESDLRLPEALRLFESVELFEERARAARPDFGLNRENVGRVADIVGRLDGLPLAIELAASRVRLLSLDGIYERLNSRLGLLTGGARDLPERHRTLRGTIAWSYDLLDEEHCRLFWRMGVFVGGCALEQAEAVCSDGLGIDLLDGLSNLADQSLLRAVDSSRDSRFAMLPTIREFALDQLAASGEEDLIRRRHAEAFLDLVQKASPGYTRRDSRFWLDRIESDHDNLRAAQSWAVERGEGEIAQLLTFAMWRFWQMRGHLREGRERSAAALATRGGTSFSMMKAEEAAGGLAYWQADLADAIYHYERALAIAREGGDSIEIAEALFNLSSMRAFSHGVDAGVALLEEALALAEPVGDRELMGRLHWGKGVVFWLHEDPETDRPEEALAEFRLAAGYFAGSDATFEIGWTNRMQGIVLLRLGRLEEAEAALRAGLAQFVAAGDLSGIPLHIADFARLALARGQDEEAIILTGAVANLQSVSETRLLDWVSNTVDGIEGATERVGRERADKLLAEGRGLSIEEVVARVT